MDPWWLYAMVFLFGYITCRIFYFFRSTRISLKLLKSSKVVYLSMLVKSIENYAASEAIMVKYLNDSAATQDIKDAFINSFEAEKEIFKKRAIQNLINHTPHTFKESIGFHDWSSAMLYLSFNRQEALKFWSIKSD